MSKNNSYEYEDGFPLRNRMFETRENNHLMTILAIVVVTATFIITVEYSGLADSYIEFVATFVSELI